MTDKNSPILTSIRPRNAVANAFASLQLMLFRKPQPPITGTPRDVIVAMLILFMANLVTQRSLVSGNVTFSVWGLEGWLGNTAIWYFVVAVAAILVRREVALGAILVTISMTLAAGALLATVWFHAVQDIVSPAVRYSVFLALSLIPSLTGPICLTMTPRWRDGWRGFVIVLSGLALSFVAASYFGQSYLFEEAYDDEESASEAGSALPDPEVIYPLQAGLLAAKTDQIADQTPGRTDLFAVLGAGYPRQAVFQREIVEMQRTLSTRFDATGRAVLLGSTVENPTERPLLNRTNLTTSLHAIAAKMDVSEDIALIFLTSHGSPDRISTHFPGLGYNDLTSAEVAAALDGSEIRYAVIIISACYSGSFVDELQSPTRLILTAAAADRTSFGCSDKNTYTDWGTAFVAEALQDTLDFRTAAEMAQATVAAREADGGLKLSQPQISEGAEIGAVLDRLAAGLSGIN